MPEARLECQTGGTRAVATTSSTLRRRRPAGDRKVLPQHQEEIMGTYVRYRPQLVLHVSPLEQGPRPQDKWCPECQMNGKPGGCPNCGRHS